MATDNGKKKRRKQPNPGMSGRGRYGKDLRIDATPNQLAQAILRGTVSRKRPSEFFSALAISQQ